eukprot:TRINITY_DN30332_c0_g1_i1.p1 TRINITY_DN30332_c0_g1~~TRINITY_DN30332_c0_g1_i1.p1  ORF type:complete len:787 (+),score=156.76 TRINITY_DN30332_c0_g1_i1:43-2403(+)
MLREILSDVPTNVQHRSGKMTSKGVLQRAGARQPVRSNNEMLNTSIESNDSAPYGHTEGDELGPKGYEGGYSDCDGDDVHLSIQELTGSAAQVNLGTSFLDRPWQPPMDSSTDEENDEPLALQLDAVSPQRANQPHRTHTHSQFVSHYNTSPMQQSASPSQLPMCEGCNSPILGKYYEKDGLTVHVECFKLFLKGSKKVAQNPKMRGGRKSPRPRRTPPPSPTPRKAQAPNGMFSFPMKGDEGLSYDESEGDVDDVPNEMQRFMPRDSDASETWLAQPGVIPTPSVKGTPLGLHSLTVSPEVYSDAKHSHQQLNDTVNLGNISPITASAVAPLPLELSQDYELTPVDTKLRLSDINPEPRAHEQDTRPSFIQATPAQEKQSISSPPSKTLSTKLESPNTPEASMLPDVSDMMKSVEIITQPDEWQRPGATAPTPQRAAPEQQPTLIQVLLNDDTQRTPWKDVQKARSSVTKSCSPAPRMPSMTDREMEKSQDDINDFSLVSQCAVVDASPTTTPEPKPKPRFTASWAPKATPSTSASRSRSKSMRSNKTPLLQVVTPKPSLSATPTPTPAPVPALATPAVTPAVVAKAAPPAVVAQTAPPAVVAKASPSAPSEEESAREEELILLKQQVRELKFAAEEAKCREEECRRRLAITEDYFKVTPDFVKHTQRVLRELTTAKVEMANMKSMANPLTDIALLPTPAPAPAPAVPDACDVMSEKSVESPSVASMAPVSPSECTTIFSKSGSMRRPSQHGNRGDYSRQSSSRHSSRAKSSSKERWPARELLSS